MRVIAGLTRNPQKTLTKNKYKLFIFFITFVEKYFDMELEIQEPAVGCIPVKYDANGRPVGITVEEWFDKLDKQLVDHFGEEYRQLTNASRKRWNEKGRWHFDML